MGRRKGWGMGDELGSIGRGGASYATCSVVRDTTTIQ